MAWPGDNQYHVLCFVTALIINKFMDCFCTRILARVERVYILNERATSDLMKIDPFFIFVCGEQLEMDGLAHTADRVQNAN